MADELKPSVGPKKRLMTQREVAEELGIDRKTLLRWCKCGTGGFPRPVKVIARTYLFCRREIEDWERDRAWSEGNEPRL